MDQPIAAYIEGKLQPVGKIEAHQRGLRHPAVSVFVCAGNDVLIQKRAAGKYHTPLLWANTCCTHPHWGEDALECARRRLDEELGISGVKPVHRQVVEYRADVGGGLIEHEVVDVYLVEAYRDLPVTPNPDEVAAVRWISIDALIAEVAAQPEVFTPWLKVYLADHFDAILGARSTA